MKLKLYWTQLTSEQNKYMGNIAAEELNRMRWAARRGMLELDLLLEPFVNQRYEQLSADDRRRFQKLMHCEDQELFGWLLQKDLPADEEIAAIVERVLNFARTAPEER